MNQCNQLLSNPQGGAILMDPFLRNAVTCTVTCSIVFLNKRFLISVYLKIESFLANAFWSMKCLVLKLRSWKGQSRKDPTMWKLCTDCFLSPCHLASSDFTVWTRRCVSCVASDVCRLAAIGDKEMESARVATDTWPTRNTCFQRQNSMTTTKWWERNETKERLGNPPDVLVEKKKDPEHNDMKCNRWLNSPFFLSHNYPWAS